MIITRDDTTVWNWAIAGCQCFQCHERADDGQAAVLWNGPADISIVLHPRCAGLLALHLAKDALGADIADDCHCFDAGPRFSPSKSP